MIKEFIIKKPVKIKAIQWTGDNLLEVLEFTGKDESFDKYFSSFKEYQECVSYNGDVFKIFTPNGTMNAYVGDWIIRGLNGEHYPCNPDIFDETYTECDD